MKVGVDARLLSGSLTGIGRYILELTVELSKKENIQIILFTHSKVHESVSKRIESIKKVTRNIDKYLPYHIWFRTVLPVLIRNEKIDLFWGTSHKIPSFIPSKIAKVVTIHDVAWKYVPYTMKRLTYLSDRFQMPHAIKEADIIAPISLSTKNSLMKYFNLSADTMKVIHPGSKFHVNTRKSLDDINIKSKYFLFVGTNEPRKNLERLLLAYSNLKNELKNSVHFVIAGGKGWGRHNISHSVKKLMLNKHVHILGQVDDDTLSCLYKHALFLAMPSLYEGFGIPIIEALSYNLPVLTSNNSSMPEAAGSSGLLVNPLDVSSITSGLETLIINEEYRLKLSANAGENASKYNWEKSSEEMIKLFNKAISIRGHKLQR